MIRIRPSTAEDMPAITAIYAHFVLHSTATFETEVPSEQEMATRRQDVLTKGLPYLVITQGHAGTQKVMGFAYANWFKPRAAYRFSAENSIYLHHDATGKGLGKLLLAELLTQLERIGIRKVMAVIGGSENLASIGLHRALGFTRAGLIEGAGWKQDRWLDLVLMQRVLGVGASQPPV
ncbi:MAG: GNAT family N-acetyltransferase [Cytophagales bacterium]|nr:GNAT family N-acetyltransferase [Cytophagales bacterium]